MNCTNSKMRLAASFTPEIAPGLVVLLRANDEIALGLVALLRASERPTRTRLHPRRRRACSGTPDATAGPAQFRAGAPRRR